MRLTAVLLAVFLSAGATTASTVDAVVASVRASLRQKHKDAKLAASLAKVALSQRLEDRVIEILESEGAGPQTLGALQRLRDASRLLPEPPDPPPGMTPPPPPPLAEERQVWEATGIEARGYIGSLPDFRCTETVHRWIAPQGNEAWQPSPTLVADLTFFDRKEQYKLLTVDGKTAPNSLLDVDGASSRGEFGTILATIFDPALETYFRWDHWTTLRKRPTSVYFFRIALSHAPHRLIFGATAQDRISTATGEHGYVYVDRETNSVTRIVQDSDDIPPDFPIQRATTVLDYDYADVGGTRFLFPLRAEIRIDAGKQQNLNTVEFHKYRKVASDAAVKYGDTPPAPAKKRP